MIASACLRIISWVALAYLVLPLAVIVGSSLTASSYLTFPPQGLTLYWYAKVFGDPSYLSAFQTSTLLSVAATLAAVALALPAALAIARYDFPGKSTLEALLMSSLILPHLVLGVALLQYCAALGIMRTFTSLLLGHIVIVTPFVLRAVLPQLTKEQLTLEEASMDLGAGPFSTFFLVTLPQIRTSILSGAIFAFITSWINVELSIFNTTAELTTVPVKLFNYVQYTIDPTIAAVSSITIIAAVAAIVLLDFILGLSVLPQRR
jgi:putative spermidine/putrescine transport system permease protein